MKFAARRVDAPVRDRTVPLQNPLLAAWQRYGDLPARSRLDIFASAYAYDPKAYMRSFRWRTKSCRRWAWAIPSDDAQRNGAK